jgi:hypothetical protein
MTIFQNKISLFVQDNLDKFQFDATWCVTKSMPDGTVLCNSLNTLSVLKSEGLSESRNQLESMRFRYPKLWKECTDARAKVLRTGKTVSLVTKFEDPSNRYTPDTDVIVVYQLHKWDEKYRYSNKTNPELFHGMYLDAWNKYIKTKCDLIVLHWKLL